VGRKICPPRDLLLFLVASQLDVHGAVRPDHPVQAAALVQLGREGHEKALRELGPVPWYVRGSFVVGKDSKGGPLIVNPRAAQLFDSPVQFVEAVRSLASGDVEQTGAEFEDFLSPAAKYPLQALYPHDPLGGYKLSRLEALKRESVESLPQYRLFDELRHPSGDDEDRLYPTSRKGALAKFGVGTIYPRPVNPKELAEQAAAEGRASLNPEQRAYRAVFENRDAMHTEAKRVYPTLLENGRLPKKLRDAWNHRAAYRRRYEEMKQDLDKDSLAPIERFRVVADVMVAAGLWTRQQARSYVASTRKLPANRIEARKNYILAHGLGGDMLAYVGAALRDRGGAFELE
jgi:hypothetical protein